MRISATLIKASLLTLSLLVAIPVQTEGISLEKLKRLIEQSDRDAAVLKAARAKPSAERDKETNAPSQLSKKAEQEALRAKTLRSETVEAGSIVPPKPVYRVLLDVRSNHSDGAHDMETLARLAEKRGLDVLSLGEHDRYTIRLGLDPLPRLIGVSQEHPSLYLTGLPEFFADLERTRRDHPSLTIMVATESTPGYFWSGIPFVDLILHDAERHIIALGAERPEQIQALPSFDLRHIRGSRSLSLVVWCSIIILLFILLLRRRHRIAALLLMATFVIALTVWLLRLDGEKGADADFINAAERQGLFTIWAHPGTLSGERNGPMGVKLDTPPYSGRVFQEPTADAFAAVYGDSDDNTLPGGLWDSYMIDYMHGYHARPIRAVAAGDYHAEGQAGEYLGNYPMDVWSSGRQGRDIITALRQGHNTSWAMPKKLNLIMPVLFLEDASGRRLLPGDEGETGNTIRLYASLSERPAPDEHSAKMVTLKGEWILDGQVAAPLELSSDGRVTITPMTLAPGAHVIRLRIPPQRGVRMEANPFLVRVSG